MALSKFIQKLFIESIHFISDPLLDNPYVFNNIRYLLAGNQNGIKKFIKKHLEENRCEFIIDFCSGTGDFAICVPSGSRYVGVDINPHFVAYAQNKYAKKNEVEFIVEDAIFSKTIYKKKYDAVLLISAVHHFSDDELKLLVPKIKQITKKVLIIADIIPDPPHIIQKFFTKLDRGRYIRPREEKIKLFDKHFKVTHTELIQTRCAVQFGFVCKVK